MSTEGLTFDPETHVYRVDGVRFPSVTQALDVLSEFEGVPRDVLEAAREFGTHVHAAVDLLNRSQLDREALDPALEPYVRAWELFLNDTGADVVNSEERVMHVGMQYAGTLDAIVSWKGFACLVDIKSGVVPRTVGAQTMAYAQARGTPWIKRYCCQLRGDGTYRMHRLKDPRDWSLFISALNIWQWHNRRRPERKKKGELE